MSDIEIAQLPGVAKETEKPRIISEFYCISDWGSEACSRRNRRARELRREGYTVECRKYDFTDLARDIAYSLLAYKGKPPMVSPRGTRVKPY